MKWCSLPYEEATWELQEDLDPEKIKEFEEVQKVPLDCGHMVSRKTPRPQTVWNEKNIWMGTSSPSSGCGPAQSCPLPLHEAGRRPVRQGSVQWTVEQPVVCSPLQERPPCQKWQKLESSRQYQHGNQLREYQLEGMNWLLFNWFNR